MQLCSGIHETIKLPVMCKTGAVAFKALVMLSQYFEDHSADATEDTLTQQWRQSSGRCCYSRKLQVINRRSVRESWCQAEQGCPVLLLDTEEVSFTVRGHPSSPSPHPTHLCVSPHLSPQLISSPLGAERGLHFRECLLLWSEMAEPRRQKKQDWNWGWINIFRAWLLVWRIFLRR